MAASIVAGQAGLVLKPSLVAETRFSRRAPKNSDGLRGNRPAPSLAPSSLCSSNSKPNSVCPARGCGSKKNRWISILGESFLLKYFLNGREILFMPRVSKKLCWLGRHGCL